MELLKTRHFRPIAIAIGCLLSICLLLILRQPSRRQQNPTFDTTRNPPLVMTGGDPYIRALMRTIANPIR
jgi:muramidase (phage lysozyme)